jgi:hypothetical protein
MVNYNRRNRRAGPFFAQCIQEDRGHTQEAVSPKLVLKPAMRFIVRVVSFLTRTATANLIGSFWLTKS